MGVMSPMSKWAVLTYAQSAVLSLKHGSKSGHEHVREGIGSWLRMWSELTWLRHVGDGSHETMSKYDESVIWDMILVEILSFSSK